MKLITKFLIAVLLSTGAVFAAEEAKPKKTNKAAPSLADRMMKRFDGIELEESQTAKIKELAAGAEAKLGDLRGKAALTEEQRKAQRAAITAAKEAGKSPEEAKESVAAAVSLTEEQKAAQVESKKIQSELNKAVTALLTDQQKEAIMSARKSKKKPAAESKKPKEKTR
ncbi:MAG: hypothetical protein AAF585_13115 [Verrucomicrobiota bacterium]